MKIEIKKPKIKGIINTETEIIYKFKPSKNTLEILDNIFEISDEVNPPIWEKWVCEYEKVTKKEEIVFLDQKKDFKIYVIMTVKNIRLILFKTKKWESAHKQITEKFEFSSKEN